MSLLRFLCCRCLDRSRSTSDGDVSSVHIVPWDGGFVVEGDKPHPEQAAFPCLSLKAVEMVVVAQHCPDQWDPNFSSEMDRV